MDTYEALGRMRSGQTIKSPEGNLFRRENGEYQCRPRRLAEWCKAGWIDLYDSGWSIYEEPVQYVGYKEAFDAALAGKKLKCPPETAFIYMAQVNHTKRLCYMGSLTAVVITEEMLTGKAWIIWEP